MPELPTAEQLAEIEQRSDKCDEARSDGTSSAAYVAAWLAESANDVPQLLGWIRTMQAGYALLGHVRRLLDQIADRENGCAPESLRVAAFGLSERIVDEIGHPATDEPALGPDLRAENQRLAAKVERLTSSTAAALDRGDKLAAALDRALTDLAAATVAAAANPEPSLADAAVQSMARTESAARAAAGCTCQDQDAGPEPSPASYDVVISALVEYAPCASVDRMAEQIAAWVLPCRRAGLAAQLTMALFRARRGRDSLVEQLADAQRERDEARQNLADMQAFQESQRQRAAGWRPKAYPARPLTPEQERSVEAGECRTDWPTLIVPCDPAVTTDGGTLWLSCTGDDLADADRPTPIVSVEPGDRWSELAVDVARHRCQPVSGSAEGEVPDADAR